MFHHRQSAFAPSVAAIQKHLGAVEKELETIGRIAGKKTSSAVATGSDQVGDAIATTLSEVVERFRQGRQAAGEQAARVGNQAARVGNQALSLGTKYGRDAVQRVSSEIEDRPLITIGVALGIGILIGVAILGSASSRRS